MQNLAPHFGCNQRQLFSARRDFRSLLLESEPIEREWAEIQKVGTIGDLRETRTARQLDRNHSAVLRQIDLKALNETRQVGDDEDRLVFETADEH